MGVAPSNSEYLIKRADRGLCAESDWAAQQWSGAETLEISKFHPRSSEHRPVTRARLLYDDTALGIVFHVQDRHVRCVHTNFQDPVSQDSCVELFVEPIAGRGYFNFEMNCGGALLLKHVIDPRRTDDGFADFVSVSRERAAGIAIRTSLRAPIDPGTPEPLAWTVSATIPLSFFDPFIGAVSASAGQTWRANLYKCGDRTPRPHWASWAPIGEKLNFHVPQFFGTLRFA